MKKIDISPVDGNNIITDVEMCCMDEHVSTRGISYIKAIITVVETCYKDERVFTRSIAYVPVCSYTHRQIDAIDIFLCASWCFYSERVQICCWFSI